MQYIVATKGQAYTGRAGEGWLSANVREAFTYGTRDGAQRVCDRFNRNTALHGQVFEVMISSTVSMRPVEIVEDEIARAKQLKRESWA